LVPGPAGIWAKPIMCLQQDATSRLPDNPDVAST
jgi:hypothetical protein